MRSWPRKNLATSCNKVQASGQTRKEKERKKEERERIPELSSGIWHGNQPKNFHAIPDITFHNFKVSKCVYAA